MSHVSDILSGAVKPPKCQDLSAAKKYRETVNLDAAEHPELAAIEHDIRTALPYNLTGDAIVYYVARHLYTDGYRKQERGLAEVAELADHLEGETIEGTHEETQIYAEDALRLATILHEAGYRKQEGTK